MPYSFNPFRGKLDNVGVGSQPIEFQSFEKIADSNDVSTKTFELGLTPLINSEIFFLNGLAQDSSCYTINGTQIILVPSFDLQINDNIIIKYAT
jgi:hypothetical protein